jgi:hypothetical protein
MLFIHDHIGELPIDNIIRNQRVRPQNYVNLAARQIKQDLLPR